MSASTPTTIGSSKRDGKRRDGAADTATFDQPRAVAFCGDRLIVADSGTLSALREVAPDGQVQTIVESKLRAPSSVAIDANGNVFFADTKAHVIRLLERSSGKLILIAGSEGKPGIADASGSNACFNEPSGLAFDGDGALWVCDTLNHRVRKITGLESKVGKVTTVAGSGRPGFADGRGLEALFNAPCGIALSRNGLVVADRDNHRVRLISQEGNVSSLAGSGSAGKLDGAASSARFNSPVAVACDLSSGAIFVADCFNDCIRCVSSSADGGVVQTLTSLPALKSPSGVACSSGELAIADTKAHRILRVARATVRLSEPPKQQQQQQQQQTEQKHSNNAAVAANSPQPAAPKPAAAVPHPAQAVPAANGAEVTLNSANSAPSLAANAASMDGVLQKLEQVLQRQEQLAQRVEVVNANVVAGPVLNALADLNLGPGKS